MTWTPATATRRQPGPPEFLAYMHDLQRLRRPEMIDLPVRAPRAVESRRIRSRDDQLGEMIVQNVSHRRQRPTV